MVGSGYLLLRVSFKLRFWFLEVSTASGDTLARELWSDPLRDKCVELFAARQLFIKSPNMDVERVLVARDELVLLLLFEKNARFLLRPAAAPAVQG